MGMKDSKTAGELRDVIKIITKDVVREERPDLRIGRVWSFDRATQTAEILFPGNTIEEVVPVRFGLDKIPTEALSTSYETDGLDGVANVVRVAGKPGAWFILDYVTGSPVNDFADQLGYTTNKAWMEETFTVEGPGTQTYNLQFLPIDFSEDMYWGPIFQGRANWSRQAKALTIKDPGKIMVAGDKITFRYEYLVPLFPDPDSAPVLWTPNPHIVIQNLAGVGVTSNSIALPNNMMIGDMIVLAISGGMQGKCLDSRMVSVGPYEDWQMDGWSGGAWVGYYDGDNTPLSIAFQTGNGAFTQFASAHVVSFRGEMTDGVVTSPIKYDPTRLIRGESHGPIPACPGKGSGAIVVAATRGYIGGGYGTFNVGRTPYTAIYNEGTAYTLTGMGMTYESSPGQAAAPQDDTGDSWRSWVIGLK